MLGATHLLRLKLCWHNWQKPIFMDDHSRMPVSVNHVHVDHAQILYMWIKLARVIYYARVLVDACVIAISSLRAMIL